MLEKLEYYFLYLYRQYRDELSLSLELDNGICTLYWENNLVDAKIWNNQIDIELVENYNDKTIKWWCIKYDEHFNSTMSDVFDEIEKFIKCEIKESRI